MAFVANPLSLSIPPASFESWLRENGHLEILDKCAVDPHPSRRSGLLSSLLGFAVNPFGNLTVEDLCRAPVAWTGEFWDCGHGLSQSYGWPISGTQLKLRMGENTKRYMGNYLRLFLFIFACFVYKMPLVLCGIIMVFALWEGLEVLVKRFNLEREGFVFQTFLIFGKIVTAVLVIYCRVAVALCWAGILSFTVMIVHSSLRKITPTASNTNLRKRQ